MAVEAKYVQHDEVLTKVDTSEARKQRASKLVSNGKKDAVSAGIVFGRDRQQYKVPSNIKKNVNTRTVKKSSSTGKCKINISEEFANQDNVKTIRNKQRKKSKGEHSAKASSESSSKVKVDQANNKQSKIVNDRSTKSKKINKLRVGGSLASMSVDVMGESEEFDESKKIKNSVSTANQVKGTAKKLSETIKARRAKAVADGVKAAERTAKATQAAAASSKAAATAGSGAKTATGGVAATAGLPVILIVLAILMGISIIIALSAILTALMGTKNNTGSLTGVEKEIAQALLDQGYNKIHVAAIMGNMSAESSFNSKALQEGGDRENLSGEERTNWQGYGLNQMTSGRKENLCNLAESRNTAHCDIGSQVAYFCTPAEKAESNWNKSRWKAYDCVPISRGEWERLNDGLDLLTTALMAFWERPNEDPAINHIEKRKSEAWRIYNALNASGGDGTIVGEAQAIADDDSHGYSQDNRDLNPDVDCSSFVFYSLQHAGYALSGSPFSTRDMRDRLLPLGFQEIGYTGLSGCVEGDVLWHSGHTEIYAGGGQSVGAHGDYDGRPGDSSGTEVNRGSADQGWSLIYRAPAK